MMQRIIILIVCCLAMFNISYAAFPLAATKTPIVNNTAPGNSEEFTGEHTESSVKPVATGKARVWAHLQRKWDTTRRNSWMGPVSFILMIIPFGFLAGIPLAIITRVERYKNRGWALAALLLYPAVFLCGIIWLIAFTLV